MLEPITRVFVKIFGERTTASGVRIHNTSDIVECNISILKTLPIHRAADIQHDIDQYLNSNKNRFGDIASNNLSSFPATDEVATPIYIITLIGRKITRIAYVGQAASATNRFKGGHSVLLKLLSPRHKHFDKYISFAIITVSTSQNERVPVEWVSPATLRGRIIDHVEHSLIWKFQPRLNSNLKSTEPREFSFTINFWGDSNEYFVLSDIRVRAANQRIVKDTPSVRPSPPSA
jgi:hypothetical protein